MPSTLIAVIAAALAANQILLRLIRGRAIELRKLAADCWNLFGETADSDVDAQRLKEMDQRLFVLQSRTLANARVFD
jgi:hypothetical protein